MFIKWVKLKDQLPLLLSIFMVIIDHIRRLPTDSEKNRDTRDLCLWV
jgi:hypothetical protein